MRAQPMQSELYGASAPLWNAPYDVETEILAAPEEGTVRGMFFDFVIDRARDITGQRLDGRTRLAFGRYPVRDYLRLLARAAALLHPAEPTREGLRRMGHTVFDEFYETMVGRAIFSVAGRKFERIVTLAPKAYEVSYEPALVHTQLLGPKHAKVVHAPMYIFADTFHVGAWEGAARFCGHEAAVTCQKIRPGYFEYEIRWR